MKENDALQVWYQPIFDLRGQTAIGVEALLRREHARRAPAVPWDLLASADLAVLAETDLHVLETVLDDASSWQRQNPGRPLQVHINLSPLLLVTDAYVDAADRLLDRHPLASWVVFEVTERQPVDPVRALPRMLRLRERGVRFALDDFGTGFSNLHCLARLPFEVVKVDRRLVADVEKHSRVATLMRGILDLTKALGLQVVAEGIETQAEKIALSLLGCSLGQGFLLGRPEPCLLGSQGEGPSETSICGGWESPEPVNRSGSKGGLMEGVAA